VLFCLRPLRPMATILYLQLVQSVTAREVVEFRRRRISDIKPREMREDWIHVANSRVSNSTPGTISRPGATRTTALSSITGGKDTRAPLL
jgi:hypothetical protein